MEVLGRICLGLGFLGTGMGAGTLAGAAILSAIVLALGEYFFHFYIFKTDLGANDRLRTSYNH